MIIAYKGEQVLGSDRVELRRALDLRSDVNTPQTLNFVKFGEGFVGYIAINKISNFYSILKTGYYKVMQCLIRNGSPLTLASYPSTYCWGKRSEYSGVTE